MFGHAPDPLLTRLIDRLFVDVLLSHPERGPELVTRLFGRVDTSRVVRFLSGWATPMDRVAVAASLPTGLRTGLRTGLFLRPLMLPAVLRAAPAQPL